MIGGKGMGPPRATNTGASAGGGGGVDLGDVWGGFTGQTGYRPSEIPLWSQSEQGQEWQKNNQIWGMAGAQNALDKQLQFVNAITQNNDPAVFNQQRALSNQLQEQAMGGGPNPALNQLALTTGQNVQNQAALMAGQRGAGANPGLLARQAAMQGGALQQQSAGQAAVLRAQQQLAAQGALGQNLSQEAGQQQNAMNAYQSARQNFANMAGGQNQASNALAVQQRTAQDAIRAQMEMEGAKNKQSFLKDLLGGIGGGVTQMGSGKAQGGVIGYADGGSIGGPSILAQYTQSLQPQQVQGLEFMPQQVQQPSIQVPNIQRPKEEEDSGGMGALAKLGIQAGLAYLTGGASAIPMAGEAYVAPGTMIASDGGTVPGQPKVFGDSEANDNVPAMLSPGEVVIPRSKVGDEKSIAAFLNALLGTNLAPGKAA